MWRSQGWWLRGLQLQGGRWTQAQLCLWEATPHQRWLQQVLSQETRAYLMADLAQGHLWSGTVSLDFLGARVFLLPPAHSCFPVHLLQASPAFPLPPYLLSLRHFPHDILAFASQRTWTNTVNCPIIFPFYKRFFGSLHKHFFLFILKFFYSKNLLEFWLGLCWMKRKTQLRRIGILPICSFPVT